MSAIMATTVATSTITKMECLVCVSAVPKSQINKCPHCEFECCDNCIKYHINTSQKTEKNCMNCKKKLSRSILVSFLGKSFVDKLYRTDIKELVFKEEMILVPRSLPELKKRKDIRFIKDKILTTEKDLQKDLDDMKFIPGTIEDFENKGIVKGRIGFYYSQIEAMKGINVHSRAIKQYKYPCENNDCNGFVDANWICSICDKETCKHCHTIKEDVHVCKQEDIDTTELIKKDSKPCPKCNISIMKSSGCDQMWCVSCHTTFDWKTMRIKTSGIFHNPEYFRYMRENGIAIPRNPNDNQCVDEYNEAYRLLTNINSSYIKEEKKQKDMKRRIDKGKDELAKFYLTNKLHSPDVKPLDDLNIGAKVYAEMATKEAIKYADKYTILTVLDNEYLKSLFTFYRDINHLESVDMRQMQNKINNAEVWKDNQRLNYLDKQVPEAKYKSDLIKQHKELEYLEESMGYHATIVDASKAYFINKINNLQGEIDSAVENKEVINIDGCHRLGRLREFIKEVSYNSDKMKGVYGYSRRDYIPRLLQITFNPISIDNEQTHTQLLIQT